MISQPQLCMFVILTHIRELMSGCDFGGKGECLMKLLLIDKYQQMKFIWQVIAEIVLDFLSSIL